MHVAWFTLDDLGGLTCRHCADDTVSKAIAWILRAELIVVDDVGLLAVAADAAEGLCRLVDAAYEKRLVAISSNLHPAGFDELMPKTLATATVDRLLQNAHICQTRGDSIRLSRPSLAAASHRSPDDGARPAVGSFIADTGQKLVALKRRRLRPIRSASLRWPQRAPASGARLSVRRGSGAAAAPQD